MTEHAAVIFVFFFLAEYSSILLMCILISILFLGGYLLDLSLFNYIFITLLEYIDIILSTNLVYTIGSLNLSNHILGEACYGIVLGIKSSILVFTFI
jgi:NADH-ubiquinone oxidoreductase chain 1